MKYFLDTEFLEGAQKDYKEKKHYIAVAIIYAAITISHLLYVENPLKTIAVVNSLLFTCLMVFLAFKKHETENTIDLISIGIVSEDGRELYEISKDFNLKEAWNRYDLKKEKGFHPKSTYRLLHTGLGSIKECVYYEKKDYWIRENVLRPIYIELLTKKYKKLKPYGLVPEQNFTYKNLKKLIEQFGKSNEEIAKSIKEFTFVEEVFSERTYKNDFPVLPIQFYAYYADYDWVVFCWLFGKMIDLPNGFPMYCKDLKQILDEKQQHLINQYGNITEVQIKDFDSYPIQEKNKQHSAIEDARWNKQFYNFLKGI